MILEVQELTTLFPEFKGAAQDRITLREILTDTRKEAKQSLFIPIVGENFDAHDFIKDAIIQGAVAALWQKDKELPTAVPTDFPVFFVEDTTKGLQEVAAYYLQKVQPLVIGITGSNGKTTTKDMTASVLSRKYKTHKTSGNFNNHIGLPLTVLAMNQDTEVLVLEMGMDRAGEISVLSKLAHPTYAIITNIGESHIENLGSREGIASAKLEIMDGMPEDGTVIIDGDELLLKAVKEDKRSFSCGFESNNSMQAKVIKTSDDASEFTINEKETYKLPLAGRHNVKNASYVIALAKKSGLSADQIQEGFDHLQMSGMRYEKHMGINDSLIINDAYNASPTSMKALIEVMAQLTTKSHKVLILGDMFELGAQSRALHRSVAEAVNEKIHEVYTIGEHSEEISRAVAEKHPQITTKHFTDKNTLSHHVRAALTAETVVLIKASRGMKLEELLNDLVK
ncbi:UDP-N-acetylmuramoyl-tripeptide--D-alanyl-D-alanine ligase [Halobacillus sp. K22]|uniref:UDP-N-acetylmuramoyl-tripeptide--D-alanyl-D- alanine ligase n=1 Tax=Halobacillus sp. K22 TaxID=3457431 RepID=UPI003FCE70E1